MANKAFKYRLYPTAEQKTFFAKTFGCCRKIWNLMLSDKIESYEITGRFAAVTPAGYKKAYPYLKETDSLALANVQLNLQAAFKNCFDKTRKKRNGFPKYKSAKRSRRSYTTNNQKGTVVLADKSIRLPKAGRINIQAVRLIIQAHSIFFQDERFQEYAPRIRKELNSNIFRPGSETRSPTL